MSLQSFSFPFPETRLFKASGFIYKFKIRGGSSFSGVEMMRGVCFNQELEDIIRTVLSNLDRLQPFFSPHFIIFPNKKRWEGLSKVMCKRDKEKLRVYPYTLILRLERNTQHGKQAKKKSPDIVKERHFCLCGSQSKRCRTDSPLEAAILQDLIEDMVADSNSSGMGRRTAVQTPCAEAEGKKDHGHTVEKDDKESEKPELKLKRVMTRGSRSPGEVQPGSKQDMEEEEEEEENAGSGRSGILTRLASHIFPLSLFFKNE